MKSKPKALKVGITKGLPNPESANSEDKNRKYKSWVCSDDLKCPICGNPVNWLKNVGNYYYNSEVTLLAECWSANDEEAERHLFLIKMNDLNVLDLRQEDEE